eukprot:CAMPEP_0113958826 /NCGR_PEP_ID=MMETSP0011_2-20120614/3721_1 /TAXON_ID=101924 /ORGANISM="Rhodosorus marinus" /LENGTH=521 /DNA_ID=CAMNT_0000969903 /DNA_START=187 /DNA_END=1752 /DNA_ORIENTATION=- /assembly_acc=CAM_ASM_000156
MDELPIDIHYAKLLDWLLDRRKVPSGWHEGIRSVRFKVNESLADLPADDDEVLTIVGGQYLDYFGCKKLLSVIGVRDVFGRYKDERGKKWLDIIAMYEKEDLFLADSAQVLAKQVDVEIPTLRRRQAKLQSSLNDAGRRESDAEKAAAKQEAELNDMCLSLGIQDASLPLEGQLRRAVQVAAPKAAREVSKLAKTELVEEALRYYQIYTKRAEVNDQALCPTLTRILGSELDAIAPEELDFVGTGEVKEVTIDWGVEVSEEPKIDFGESEEGTMPGEKDAETAEPKIDFGDFGVTLDEADAAYVDEGEPVEIDWGDSNDQPEAAVEIKWDADAEQANVEDKGSEMNQVNEYSLLNETTRNEFLTDLYEISAFLDQREKEWQQSGKGGGLGVMLLDAENRSLELRQFDAEKISKMKAAIEDVLSSLTLEENRRALTLKSSLRALHRMVKSLEEKKYAAERLKKMVSEIETRRRREAQELKSIGPRLERTIAYVKELKANIEDALSKQYKPRKVNLMGEINTL